MIVEGLTSLGWKVCRCPYQADTHIGELCRDETDKASLAVISNDSDLLIYDGVSCVTMPVGKSRELTTFSKASLLEELDLPSSRHLQLAAMLTKNDYFGGTRTYGIIRNAELVRNLLLDIDGKEDEQELISKFHSAIGDYFALIKNVKDFPIDDDISNAISAFVLCREDRSDSATPSPQTHQRVSDVLRQLEYAKLQRRGLLSQACTTISNVSSSSTNELTITTGSLETQSVLSLNNSGKAKQSRKESAKMKKQERWTKARFKSPNLDKNPRYTAHVVKDVTSACPVAQGTLGKLTLSVPRPRKPKKEQEMQPENACQESAKKEQEIEPGKPCQDSAKKKQQKGLADMRKKGPSAGPKEGKKREIGDCKILKNLFDTTFKTVTLTLGCFTGTLRRATSMTQDEAQVVASHMDKAAHTLSKARILVFKGLEYFVYRQVTSKTPSTNIVQSNVVNMQSSSESITINHPPSSSSPSMDPLDLFLNKQHGQTLIRNLISLILNGKINGGRSSKDPCGIQARQEAQQIYRELELVFSGVIPLNVKDDRMCLATAIGEMAAKIFTSIRVHFGRLPELISTRMLKIGCGQDSLTDITIEPPSTGKSEASIGKIMDVSEIDQVDTEEAEADRYKFDPGHVMECWSQYIRLPLELRPVFVPTAGFRDTFQQLSERDLIPLLWGDKRSKIVPPTKSIMDSHVCSREEAETAEQSHYGDLVRKLFIGDKENIRDDRKKRQTSYGKRSTTMGFLSDDCQAFSRSSLQQYVDSHFAYINAKKGLVLGSSNALPSPPTLPRSNVPAARYALSNQLYTDGIQVHVVAYDTRKPRVGSNQKTSIPKLEKRFPNRQSMVNDLGVSFEDTVVVGIDPGEKISAAFCMVDPKRPKQVSNLSIRRNALYSPSLSYRARLEEMKRHRITVSTASGISPSPWTPADEIQVTTPIGESETQRHDMDTIELPISINELQQSLEQSAFQSMEAYEEGLRNCAGVFQLLNGFYSSRSLKKLHWERMKAMRAEKDLAVHGALRMIRGTNGRKAIFAYGDGKFNTRTKLSSMHETFKNYFVMKIVLTPSPYD
ncbi:hypothetical protein B0O80DRAFT_420925 [Mortierella sp. GBAus27b]|nr:hypothetical protein B0O80DRAFT_420925 [Mortierella sp. GBAus27b]